MTKAQKTAAAQANMIGYAALLLEKRQLIETLKEEISGIETKLTEHFKETGETNFKTISLIQKTGTAKLTGLKNKALKVAIEQLQNELNSKYVTRSLDVEKMFSALSTDKALNKFLTEKGLTITQPTSIVFKEIKK